MADDPIISPLSTPTTNYGWAKPTVGGDGDAWGGMLNSDLDGIDSVVHSIQVSIPAPYVLPTASTTVLGGVKVDGSTITIASGVISGASASITISDTPPSSPAAGALWFNSAANNAQLYVYYNDGNSSQWVPTTNQLGGGYLAKAGVTDGSDAPAGQIGEVISSNVVSPGVTLTTAATSSITSIALTAGDWDVSGEVWIAVGTGGATIIQAAINSSAGFPPASGIGTARMQLIATVTASNANILSLRTARVSLSVPATYYLLAQASFPSGTTTAYGNIWARRAR